MIKRFSILLLSFLLLTSCKVGNSLIAFSTVTPVTTDTPTSTSTATLTPTQTSTPTVSPDVMRYQCLEIASSLPSNHALKGVIVYNDDRNEYAYLSNEETNKPYFFPREEGDQLFDFEVSPDGMYLIYDYHSVRTKGDHSIIVTADGKSIWSEAINDYSWQWFDNKHLQRVLISENGIHTLVLLNPFTGERQSLPADFPSSEMYSDNFFLAWTGAISPVYDPTLTRVVYGSGFHDNTNLIHPVVTLWDTQSNQKLWEMETTDWGNTPLWTPDGKQFLLSVNFNLKPTQPYAEEFFSVSRDGELRQLTHFMDYYKEIYILDNYTLSPNGKLLAFWLNTKYSQSDGLRLAILNIETGEVINYCIMGDGFADNEKEPSSAVWSPDSTQLLIISRPPEDTKIRRVVMVDVVNNYAAQINQDIRPVGWMVAP